MTSAHAWIIDGARLYTVDYGGSTGVDNIHNLYYHCVWGWGTQANGYKFRDVVYGYVPNK